MAINVYEYGGEGKLIDVSIYSWAWVGEMHMYTRQRQAYN